MKAELIIDAPILGTKEIWIKRIFKSHFDHPLHFHDYYELVWVQYGYGKMIIGDFAGTFDEDELIMVAPKISHLWRNDEIFYDPVKSPGIRVIGIYFSAKLLLEISDDPDTLQFCKVFLHKLERGIRFCGNTRTEIIESVKKIIETKSLEQLIHFFKIIQLANSAKEFELLTSIGCKPLENEEDMMRYNNVYNYLLNNFQKDITLAEIASVCNMVPNAFCAYFKKKTQKTFTQLVNELRIGHAKKLLKNENLSVNDICYECGYNNPTNFYKFFKKISGRTPLEFRREMGMANA